MSDEELGAHVPDLQENGYIILRKQIAPEYLDPLRDIAQRAADDYIAEWRGGMKLPEVRIVDGKGKRNFTINPNARACFMWGEAAMDLLDHDTVHAICERALGTYHFLDLVANTVRYHPEARQGGFHRDFRPGLTNEGVHNGLWCFFMLDGYSEENGGTWVIPRTHCFKADEPETMDPEPDSGSNNIQATGDPGDLLIVNAGGLHCGGVNQTPEPRRTLNIRIVPNSDRLFYNAWELAGPKLQAKASERVKRFMQPPDDRVAELRTDWRVTPRLEKS
jgi:hypothetical protein